MMEKSYRFEDVTTSVHALLTDVNNTLLKVALKGHCSPERRQDMQHKLEWASRRLAAMPTSEKP